ncbi:sensor histidine kinase [Ensifer soli]|uniref:sensor histidine kinase n=1 Tax=Ciceribacter sp. sgz301302 TaxID=3342379 RepID=UPI0035B71931
MDIGRIAGRTANRSGARLHGFLRRHFRRPFVFYLVVLLTIALVPTFAFSLLVMKRSVDQQERVIASLLTASSGSVTRIVEREIDGLMTTLRVISTLKSIENPTLSEFHESARLALAGTGTYLALIDQDLKMRVSTRVPFDGPLPSTISNQKAVGAAMRSDRPFISGVFLSTAARRWVYSIYLPRRLADGRPYVLALTQDASSMAKAVNRDTLSPAWNAALVDGAGKVIVSSDGQYEAGTPFFLDEGLDMPQGLSDRRVRGVTYRVVNEFSPQTGWRVVAWAKRADVDSSAIWTYFWLVAGGIVSATFAAIGSLVIGRLLARGIRLLAADARRVGAGQPVAARSDMITEVETVSAALAEASEARAAAENEIRFLMREVAHRSKNQLTVIQSMLNQSAASSTTAAEFADGFRKRVAGLARSTDLMIANATHGVDLRELAQNQLQPFTPSEAARLRLAGPAFRLDTQASQTLGMALHELATNATKYGAFAGADGRVALDWSLDGDGLVMVWRESGVALTDAARASARKGFGTMVLERMMRIALDATLERTMHEDGIEWRMRIPRARLAPRVKEQAE